MSTKLVLINRRAMTKKYGPRASNVLSALQRLVAADKKRGLQTTIVAIDDARAMKRYGVPAASDPPHERSAKIAVDAAFHALHPDYLLLVDGPDVIPQQTLTKNVPDDDDGGKVPSDLPYACDVGPSKDASKFTRPTRVIGRLPGITGGDDPTWLLAALDTAIKWRPQPYDDNTACLAIAASSFQAATEKSLDKIFGNHRDVQPVPPGGPSWPKHVLGRRLHLFDCHGVDGWSDFEGSGKDYPIALHAKEVAKKLPAGVVASAQCCYSAQLYDPKKEKSPEPMVNSYLRRAAYGYFGSSTQSYGSSQIPALGDLLCQFFLHHVLHGASTGRAALEARHDFLAENALTDPAVLKSLAQFALFGDPSVHATWRQHDGLVPAEPKDRKNVHAMLAVGRAERRLRLHARGEALHAAATVFDHKPQKTKAAIARRLQAEIRDAGGETPSITSHPARSRPVAKRLRDRFGNAADAVHIATAMRTPPGGGRPQRLLVIAHESNGRLVSLRHAQSKG